MRASFQEYAQPARHPSPNSQAHYPLYNQPSSTQTYAPPANMQDGTYALTQQGARPMETGAQN
jgi:hypothetical protein